MKAKLLGFFYASVAALLFWQLLFVVVDSPIIPSPFAVIPNLCKTFTATIAVHLAHSLFRVLAALAISLVLGVCIGIICAEFAPADRLISPLIYLLMPIPKIAFLPVLMIFFGLGDGSKVILIVIIIIFQFLVSARDAMKRIPKELQLYEKTLQLSFMRKLFHFILPAILPDIFTALRINLGIGIAVLFFSESFATKYGIGYFIMNNWIMANYLNMASGILAISLMGIVLFLLLDVTEARLCKYKKQ